MSCDYEKISKNWKKFLAEGSFLVTPEMINEGPKTNLVGKRITKPSKKGKGKIVDKILSKLPKPLQNKPMKAALAIGIRAVRDEEISAKDVWAFVKAATNFAMADDKESKALAKKQLDGEKVAQLPKVNIDFLLGSLRAAPTDPDIVPGLGQVEPSPAGALASVRLRW